MAQNLVVALIVALAFAYSAWVLMPVAWQRALRGRLGLAVPAEAGGCSGCGGGCAATPPVRPVAPGLAVIQVHRRLPASGDPTGNATAATTRTTTRATAGSAPAQP